MDDQQKTFSDRFHWMYGLEEYMRFYQHPQKDKYMKIVNAVHHGDPWAIRDLIMYEIDRGKVELTELFANAMLLHYLNKDMPDLINNRDMLQFISHSIDDNFIKDVSSWSIKWGEKANLGDHFSRGQIKSKIWMVDQLSKLLENKNLGTVLMYGGWYATVANILFHSFNINKYYNLEIDNSILEMADNFNYRQVNQGKFKSLSQDVNLLQYDSSGFCMLSSVGMVKPNVVINTSCEHMTDKWFHDLPDGQFVVLQTNNYFKNTQHINCVHSVDDALKKYKFSQVLYSGELETFLYNRFMIIGIK